MNGDFIFSKEHLIILLFFSVFLYVCPKLTKNLLPYSYIVEKVICALIILEIVSEQVSLISMGGYDTLNSLPISPGRFCSYICIAILYFKKYQLFNVFFSWSLVCSIGEIIFFKSIPYRFPNILYFLFIFSKMILVYANVYLMEVRKFKISSSAIKDNLITCIIYFSFLFFLNIFTNFNYNRGFSDFNILNIIIFIISTNIIYIPALLFDKDNFKIKR